MKHSYFVLILFLFFGNLDAQELTLSRCQSLAIKNSEKLSIEELELLIQSDKVWEYRAKLFPQISINGSLETRDTQPATRLRGRSHGAEEEGPPQPRKIAAGDQTTKSSQVTLTIPITDCGFTHYRVKAQKKTLEATEQHRNRMVQDLLYETTTTYLEILEAQKMLRVVTDSLQQLKQQLACAQDFFEAGLTTKNDVLVVEVQYAEREQQYFEEERDIESLMAHLNRLMGISVSEKLTLEDVSEDILWNKNLDSVTQKALIEHPDLKELFAAAESKRYTVSSTKCANNPTFSLFGNYNYASERTLYHNNWLVGGVGVSFPLFDGGVTWSQARQQKDALQQLDLSYRAKVKDIELDVKRAFLSVESAVQKLPIAKKSIAVAEENLRIMRNLFEEGLVTMNDVVDDETRLTQAKANYYKALYDFYTANVELDYAAGLLKEQV